MPRFLSEKEVDDFRARLVDAATRRFTERGVAGVTLRGLADEVGCSRMTPYRYFQNKEDILAAVRAAAFSRLADATEAAASRASGPLQRLEYGGRAYLRFAARNPDQYRLMFEISKRDEETYPELAKQLARSRSWMTEWAEESISAGLIEGDPKMVMQLYWAGMHGVIALEIAGKLTFGRSFDRLSKEMVRTLFRGMAPSNEGPDGDAPLGRST